MKIIEAFQKEGNEEGIKTDYRLAQSLEGLFGLIHHLSLASLDGEWWWGYCSDPLLCYMFWQMHLLSLSTINSIQKWDHLHLHGKDTETCQSRSPYNKEGTTVLGHHNAWFHTCNLMHWMNHAVAPNLRAQLSLAGTISTISHRLSVDFLMVFLHDAVEHGGRDWVVLWLTTASALG